MSEADRVGGVSRRQILGGALAVTALVKVPLSTQAESAVRFRSSDHLLELDRFGDAPPLDEIVAAWRALPAIADPVWTPIATGWTFAPGPASEGLHAELTEIPASLVPVTLPHRPGGTARPLWYRTKWTTAGPVVLRLDADAGAHLWIEGRRIPYHDGTYRADEVAAGPHDLTIRVLDRSGEGGLIAVDAAPLADCDRFAAERDLRHRLAWNIRKLRLLEGPPEAIVAAARAVVAKPNGATLADFETLLAAYPIDRIAPALFCLSANQAILAWESDVPNQPHVSYQPAGAAAKPVLVQSEGGTHHLALFSDLPPNGVVTYQIEGREPQRFRMLPDAAPMLFTVWGDAHIGFDPFRQNVAAMARESAAFTVGLGDQVVDADQSEPWQTFFEIAEPLFRSTPVFLVGGDHEYDGCYETLVSPLHRRWGRLNGKPWHAWSAGGCRFVAIDPNIEFPTGISAESQQYKWLMAEMERPEWSAASWRFLFVHQPPYSQGHKGYPGEASIRSLFETLIPTKRIDFVVSGHTHDYEKLTKTYNGHSCTFLVLGGAGARLESGGLMPQPEMDAVQRRHHYGRFFVRPDVVRFECVATDARVLDAFDVHRAT